MKNISLRLLKLEQSQPHQHFCWPLSYFYGEPAASQVRLTQNLSLSDFYASITRKDQQNVVN